MEYLTSKQVCERLNVNISTLYRWIEADQITAYKTPGGALRFRSADVDGLYTKREPTPA